MKNPQIHSYERTNYYSGMLLSEKDMTNEQQYLNSRRYLGNRFLHGTGVAGGMTVIKVDEEILSLETGLAIDKLGREIIVDKPKLIHIDRLNGYEEFKENKDSTRAFLCIRYAEEKIQDEEVALTNEEGTERCKRVREGYELYLTENIPTDFSNTPEYFYGQDTILYRDDNVCVMQRIPNFIEAGKAFDTQIEISNFKADVSIELHLDESLSCISYNDKEEFVEDIRKTCKEKYSMETYPYTLNAYNIENGTAELRVSPDHSYIIVNGEKKELIQDLCLTTAVTAQNEYEETIERYYQDYFEHQKNESVISDLYLAAIYVKRHDNKISIDRIDGMPYRQYVMSSFLQMGISQRIIKDINDIRKELKRGEKVANVHKIPITRKPKMSSGEYVFKIALGAKEGQRLISEEIVHGLGLGPVTVSVSQIEEMNQLQGASGIFDEMELKLETAVLTDMSKGSFRIGVKVNEVTAVPEIKIHWTAIMNPAEQADDERQKRVRIIPDKLEMKTLQNYYLKAETDNLPGATILWEVITPNGGIIGRDGLYTAPDLPGLYEISVFCQDAPEIKDNIFIIVRE